MVMKFSSGEIYSIWTWCCWYCGTLLYDCWHWVWGDFGYTFILVDIFFLWFVFFLPYFYHCFITKPHILCHLTLRMFISIKIFLKSFLLINRPNRTTRIMIILNLKPLSLTITFNFRLSCKYTLNFNLCPNKMSFLNTISNLIPWSSYYNTFY